MRRTVCVALVLGACLVTGAPATSQIVTLPDPGETVSDVIEDATSTVGDTVGTAQETVSETVSETATTPSSGSGSTSTSSGGTSSSEGSSSAAGSRSSSRGRAADSGPRTRFDRLPPRLERLLERIELGRNVRANLRRLEQALASASPELRRRVLRLIRAEIRRLERGDVTPRERRRIERLRLVLETLTSPSPSPSSGGSQVLIPDSAGAGAEQGAQKQNVRGENTGVLGTQARGGGGEQAGGGGGGEQPQSRPIPIPPAPPGTDGLPFVLGLVLFALLVLGFVGLVAGVTNHVFGRARSG
jgi:hypothetical protein